MTIKAISSRLKFWTPRIGSMCQAGSSIKSRLWQAKENKTPRPQVSEFLLLLGILSDYPLRGFAPGRQQRTQEVVIVCVHDVVTVRVLPPATAKVARVTGTELGGASFDLLEATLE